MATLTIYLDEKTLDSVTAAAKPAKGWPEGYFEKIQSWGESDLEAPEEIPIPLDDIRLDEPEPAQSA